MKSILIKFSFSVAVFFLIASSVRAEELSPYSCSKNGYTILAVNGIFTNEAEAKNNAYALKKVLSASHNGQAVTVDYLYNPTHISGAGDILDSIKEGLFDDEDSGGYDLSEMITDASQLVKTQKVLLVGHSQGNFYVNSFYTEIANEPTGIPSQSIGAYAIATPSDHVAGGGRYVTSDTDTVIARVVGHLPLKKILPPNIHISLQGGDGLGHGFSDVYLKYLAPEISSDIVWSLDRLYPNTTQTDNRPCILASKPNFVHQLQKVFFTVADTVAQTTLGGFKPVSAATRFLAHSLYARASSIIGSEVNTAEKTQNPNLAEALVETQDDPVNTVSDQPPAQIDQDPTPAPDPLPIEIDQDPGQLMTPDPSTPTPVVVDPAQQQNSISPQDQQDQPSTGGVQQQIPAAVDTPRISGQNQNPVPMGGVSHSDPVPDSTDPEPQPQAQPDSSLTQQPVTSSQDDTPPASTPLPVSVPVITLTGSTSVTIEKNPTYTDPGATAVDATGTALAVTTTSTVNSSVPGTYTITYLAKDASGNTTTAIRTVIITATKKYFDGDNKIAYTGNFLVCDVDTHTVYGSGTSSSTTFVSSSNWHTTQMRNPNENMPIGKNLRFIFGGDSQATSDCTSSTFIRDYSDTFHYETPLGTSVVADDGKIITSFVITSIVPNINTTITDSAHAVVVAIPPGVDSTHLVPHITLSSGATVSPASEIAQDFTNPVIYTVTAADGSIQTYAAHTVAQGTQLPFDANNQIAYTGNYILCNVDSHTSSTSGSTIGFSNYLSSTNWQTRYQATPNVNMAINTNYRFIFGDGTIAKFDCKNDTYVDSYSNTFYYTTPSGDSVTYGRYTPAAQTDPADPSSILPTIIGYTINGAASSVTIDPIANPVQIALIASKIVNWLSIKIENMDDPSLYKIFQSGSLCVDGTGTCIKRWDGTLSSGGLLHDGVFRIRAHIKDQSGNEFEEYLTPYTITVDVPDL